MKKICLCLLSLIMMFSLTGCDESLGGTKQDVKQQLATGNELASNQPTPTDIDYSLERYNLIKRAYWVNGQREKALAYPCGVVKPLGYVVLFSETGVVIGQFTVDGKVSSLNSFLTPDSEWYECSGEYCDGRNDENDWLPDVDGSYGTNDNGIFFFTTDNKYIEWTGMYLYSDIPFQVDSTLLGGY